MNTIKLAYSKNALMKDKASYKVLVVKNSTAYHPGEILDKDDVDRLCNSPKWDVTVIPTGG